MKKMIRKIAVFGMVAVLLATAANAAGDVRYKDRMFNVEKSSDVVYATDVPQLKTQHQLSKTLKQYAKQDVYFYANETDTEPVDLKMDIYTPKGDKATKRAAVIVAHGGAMISGAKDHTTQKSVAYCDSLAARGFVAASIGYRLGVSVKGDFSLKTFLKKGSSQSLTVDSADYARAVYRGVQDINAAVRYMRANADELGIDPKRIYLVGNSSGAILAIENIYANSKSEFPSYMEYNGVPELGGLNDYGVQNVDAHANGGVFLWGAIHDPAVIAHNKTPVLLVHGEDDETVLFKTGRPLQTYSVSDVLPKTYAERLSVQLETPTLYGSYVIDSALAVNNGKKARPETYFVENAEHEFYDTADYTKEVQTKVFDFLYKLVAGNKIVYSTAAITITEDDDGKYHAIIDGDYDGTGVVSVDKKINVKDVVLERTFSTSGFSTILLPFAINGSKVTGVKQFLKFNGVLPNANGVKEVHMKRAWCDYDVVSHDIDNMNISEEQKQKAKNACKKVSGTDIVLSAYMPYILQLNEKLISFDGAVTFVETKNPADTVVGNWLFRGTLTPKKWFKGDVEWDRAYGYTGTAKEGINIGDFVKAGNGSSIGVLRSYLLYSPESNASKVRGVSLALENRSLDSLPETMNVLIDDDDDLDEQNRAVIGVLDTRTGEFRDLRLERRTFDLKGRYVGTGRKAMGVYVGK